jgi:septal ring factor EnvC (AmiA/AmiB activator)
MKFSILGSSSSLQLDRIPLSLQAQFRPVSIKAPDMDVVFTAYLTSYNLSNMRAVIDYLTSVTDFALKILAPPERSRRHSSLTYSSVINSLILQLEHLIEAGKFSIDGISLEQSEEHVLSTIYLAAKKTFRGLLPVALWPLFEPVLSSHAALTTAASSGRKSTTTGEMGCFAEGSRYCMERELKANLLDFSRPRWTLLLISHSHIDLSELVRSSLRLDQDSNIRVSPFLPCNSYSKSEFLGHSDDVGKWRDGIVSSTLKSIMITKAAAAAAEDVSKPVVLIAEFPADEQVAETFSVLHDTLGTRRRIGTDFPFPLSGAEDGNVRLVFVARSMQQCRAGSLLNRLSVLRHEETEEDRLLEAVWSTSMTESQYIMSASRQLIALWGRKCIHRKVNVYANKAAQMQTIFCALLGEAGNMEERQDVITNALIYAFFWSFCSDHLRADGMHPWEEDLAEFLLDKKQVFGAQSLLPEVSLYHQHFDLGSLQWIRSTSLTEELVCLMERLLLQQGSNNSVLFIGAEIARMVMLHVCEKLSSGSGREELFQVAQVTDLRGTIKAFCKSKDTCTLHPASGGKKLILLVEGIHQYSESDLHLLRDIVTSGYIYRSAENYERMQLTQVAVVAHVPLQIYNCALVKDKPFLDGFVTLGVDEGEEEKDDEEDGLTVVKNLLSVLARGDQALAKEALAFYRDLTTTFSHSSSPNPIVLMRLLDTEVLVQVFGRDEFPSRELTLQGLHENMYRIFYVPLYTQESRGAMKILLQRQDIWMPGWVDPREPNVPFVQTEAVSTIARFIKSDNNILSIVGSAGVGKNSAIKKACAKNGLDLEKTSSLSKLRKTLGTKTEKTAIHIAMGGWGKLWEENLKKVIRVAKGRPKNKFFLVLGTNSYGESMLCDIFNLLREFTVVIGIPEWLEQDLSCDSNSGGGGGLLSDDDTDEAEKHRKGRERVREWLVNIHMSTRRLCEDVGAAAKPSASLFHICLRLCLQQIASSQSTLRERKTVLSKIFSQFRQFSQQRQEFREQLNSIEDKLSGCQSHLNNTVSSIELMDLEMETVSSARQQIVAQMSDFEKQLVSLRSEMETAKSRIVHKFTTAKNYLSAMSDEAIDKFCNALLEQSQHLEPVGTILIYLQEGFTSCLPDPGSGGANVGGSSAQGTATGGDHRLLARFCALFKMDDWRAKLFSEIDPWNMSKVSLAFIKLQLKGFEYLPDPKFDENATYSVQFLVDLCDGIVEIDTCCDEIAEFNTKISECELILAKTTEEEEALCKSERELSNSIEETLDKRKDVEAELKRFSNEAKKVKAKIEKANSIKDAFGDQIKKWEEELNRCIRQEESLVAKEALTAAAKVYLLLLPLEWRKRAFEEIKAIVGYVDEEQCKYVQDLFVPWNDTNLITINELPGWHEMLTEPVCLVYDPNDLLPFLLRNHRCKILHIHEEEDYEKMEHAWHGLVENNGECCSIIIPQFSQPSLADFVRANLKPGLRVFLVSSTRYTTIPSGLLFVNLSLTPSECRKMFLHCVVSQCKTTALDGDRYQFASGRREAGTSRPQNAAAAELSLTHMALNVSIDQTDIEAVQRLTMEEDKLDTVAAAAAMDQFKDSRLVDEEGAEKKRVDTLLTTAKIPAAILGACHNMNTILNQSHVSISRYAKLFAKLAVPQEMCNIQEVLLKREALDYPLKSCDLFKFLISLHYLVVLEELDDNDLLDLSAVCVGKSLSEIKSTGSNDFVPMPSWCSKESWDNVKQIKQKKSLNLAMSAILKEEWKSWYCGLGDDSGGFPSARPKPDFSEALLAIALRPERTQPVIFKFLYARFPQFLSWECDVVVLRDQLLLSDCVTPTAFLLNNAPEDPSVEIERLALEAGLTDSKLKYYAIHGGEGERDHLLRLLHTAGVRGQWLVLQNTEQNERTFHYCSEYLDESPNIHKDFRLWLTISSSESRLAADGNTFLQRCMTISCQKERTIRIDYGGEQEAAAAATKLKPQLIMMLEKLHKSWLELSVQDGIFWNASTQLPFNRIIQKVATDLEGALPKMDKLLTASDMLQMHQWLLHYVYLPHVQCEQDISEINEDLLELVKTIAEYYGIAKIPPKDLWVIYHLCVPLIRRNKHIKRRSLVCFQQISILQQHQKGTGEENRRNKDDYALASARKKSSLLDFLVICHEEQMEEMSGSITATRSILAKAELTSFLESVRNYLLLEEINFSSAAESGAASCVKGQMSFPEFSEVRTDDLLSHVVEKKVQGLLALQSPIELALFSCPSLHFHALLCSLQRQKNRHQLQQQQQNSPQETEDGVEASLHYDLVIELYKEASDGDSSRQFQPESDLDCLFSGVYLYGGTWRSNSEGVRTESRQTELQDLKIVRLRPTIRSDISPFQYAKLPVYCGGTSGNDNVYICYFRVLMATTDDDHVILARNVKFFIGDILTAIK